MTDKKALEVLKSWLQLAYQNADGTDECCAELYEALQTVFALINRQQEEIERLKGYPYATQVEVSKKLESQIKSEAVKECLAKVENYIKTHCNPYGKPDFEYDTSIKILNFIDNLVKEMVGDKE